LVEIVLLDSGRLQEEFAKRHMRWERRHPLDASSADAKAEQQYAAALELARQAEADGHVPTSIEPAGQEDADCVPGTTHPTGAASSDPVALAANADATTDPAITDAGTVTVAVVSPLAHAQTAEVAMRTQPTVVEA